MTGPRPILPRAGLFLVAPCSPASAAERL